MTPRLTHRWKTQDTQGRIWKNIDGVASWGEGQELLSGGNTRQTCLHAAFTAVGRWSFARTSVKLA